MPPHILRPDTPPIPPIKEHTEYIDAGPLTVGVEYRVLDDSIYEANFQQKRPGADEPSAGTLSDSGVSLHVGETKGGELAEYLRFDCFDEDPHYHYIQPSGEYQEIIHLDPIADGDALSWAIDRLRSRLPAMLERAGASDLARKVDTVALDEALPKVAEVAYRYRFHAPSEDEIRAEALNV